MSDYRDRVRNKNLFQLRLVFVQNKLSQYQSDINIFRRTLTVNGGWIDFLPVNKINFILIIRSMAT